MLCLNDFELYSRWVPLNHILPSFLPYLAVLLVDLVVLCSKVDSLRKLGTFSWTHYNLTLGRTRKFIPLTRYKGGEGGCRTLLRGFEKIFFFSGKSLIFSVNKRYILRVVALVETHRVTNNDRHLGLYQELEILLKLRETDIFLVLGHLK